MLNGKGIWLGLLGGTAMQTIILLWVTFRTNWEQEVCFRIWLLVLFLKEKEKRLLEQSFEGKKKVIFFWRFPNSVFQIFSKMIFFWELLKDLKKLNLQKWVKQTLLPLKLISKNYFLKPSVQKYSTSNFRSCNIIKIWPLINRGKLNYLCIL